ncbi:UNVERIFIED_CONTAM: hypothetical protein GTU68_055919, partial [Idotea baltica]|nr:hypothetical protein [Idotea baltica]
MKRSLAPILFALVLLTPLSAGAVEPKGDEQRGIVYDFGASWCVPCQQIAPLVNRLKREGLPIRKVDIEQEPELAERFRIARVPTFVLVVDGKEVLRKRGA